MSLVISQAEYTPETNLSANIITKLYNLAFTKVGGQTTLRQDAPTTLIGTVSLSGPTYQEYVTSLTSQYPQLHISASAYYVLFEDPVVQQICATQWGDGTGITTTQVASVSNNSTFKSAFTGSNIVKFNELQQFTNLDLNYSGILSGLTSLQEISLPSSCTVIAEDMFNGDTSLVTINNTNSITAIRRCAFHSCSQLQEIYLPYCATMWNSRTKSASEWADMFGGCTNLKKITLGKVTTFQQSPGGWSNYYERVIFSCPNLEILDLGDQITSYGGQIFHNGCANMKAIIFRTTTPPSVTVINDNLTWGNGTSVVYVPASALSTYQATAPFDSLNTAGRLNTIENAIANDIIDA